MSPVRFLFLRLSAVAIALSSGPASSSPSDDISRLELAASGGVQSASNDLNRGLAYLQRGLSAERTPQDLGQAIAGLEAARAHTRDAPVNRAAGEALRIARAEVAKARNARGETDDFAPQGWLVAFLAKRPMAPIFTGASLVLALALALAVSRRKLGGVAASLGLAWACALSLAVLAHRSPARSFVLIAADARPESPAHVPVAGASLTQGALIHGDEARADEPGWVRFELRGESVLLPADALREL